MEKWKPCGLATRTCLRAEGVFCGEVEDVRAGNPHLLKSWGVFCGEVEAMRAGNPHLLKSWGGVALWSLRAGRGGGGVLWRSGGRAGWQPALA